MAEQRKISPVLVIAAGAGIAVAAAAGIYALARVAPPKVYTCPYCPATFSTHEELVEHVQLVHPVDITPAIVIGPITWE